MKTHLSFTTADLAAAAAFYTALLDARPTKRLDDYALFITEQPALELALELGANASPASDAHYGIFVENAAGVERAIERLERAGLVAAVERETACCYANQTKVWATDPDGRRWEIYTVHEEMQARDDACGGGDCCAA